MQAGLRSQLEQGLQMLLAGPDLSSRLKLQLAMRIDEVAARRRMHGSLRFRSAQELADRLVVSLFLPPPPSSTVVFCGHVVFVTFVSRRGEACEVLREGDGDKSRGEGLGPPGFLCEP